MNLLIKLKCGLLGKWTKVFYIKDGEEKLIVVAEGKGTRIHSKRKFLVKELVSEQTDFTPGI